MGCVDVLLRSHTNVTEEKIFRQSEMRRDREMLKYINEPPSAVPRPTMMMKKSQWKFSEYTQRKKPIGVHYDPHSNYLGNWKANTLGPAGAAIKNRERRSHSIPLILEPAFSVTPLNRPTQPLKEETKPTSSQTTLEELEPLQAELSPNPITPKPPHFGEDHLITGPPTGADDKKSEDVAPFGWNVEGKDFSDWDSLAEWDDIFPEVLMEPSLSGIPENEKLGPTRSGQKKMRDARAGSLNNVFDTRTQFAPVAFTTSSVL